jgi:hypothetical protein
VDARTKATIEAGKLAEIEADFVEAKQSDAGADRQLRAKLEKARREYREKWRIPTGASVQPAAVSTSAEPTKLGG